MASERVWLNTCEDCGRRIEILNGDLQFSMELHKQSHKSLEMVNKETDKYLEPTQKKLENASGVNVKYCEDCKEYIEIINNDLDLSLQIHAEKQKHITNNADVPSNHSPASSKKRKSKNKTKNKPQMDNAPSKIVEDVFHSMPDALKSHQGFILKESSSKAICNLCEITVEPIFSLAEHLKTKLHEDNIIQVIKILLPSELNDQMEFVSFCNSNLCCNLCECKIDLCSDNLHKTLVNIFAHNHGKSHLSRKSNRSDIYQTDKLMVDLKTFALTDPLVNENQNFIEHRVCHNYKCTLCDKVIAYSENDRELLNNLRGHLNSPGHNKSLSAVSLLNKWHTLNVIGKETHPLIVAKQSIYCISCSCLLEANLDQLLAHTRKDSPPSDQVMGKAKDRQSQTNIEQLPSTSTKLHVANQGGVKKTKKSSDSTKPPMKNQIDVKEVTNVMKSSEKTICNLRYLDKRENQYYFCRLCKTEIHENCIMLHVKGKKHKKKSVKELTDMIDMLELSSPEINSNRKFLSKKDDQVSCTLCKCTISLIDDVHVFKQNLLMHFNEYEHVQKKMAEEKSNISTSTIQDDVLCRQCHSIIHGDFLKEHLENCKIFKDKLNYMTLTSPSSSQHVMSDQNMGTLSSLLQNISQKSPWQK